MYEFYKFCLQNFVQISLYLPRDKNFKKVSMSAKLPKSNTGNFFSNSVHHVLVAPNSGKDMIYPC